MRQSFNLATASPAVANAVAWTRERSRREQMMIAFLGGLVLATAFWFAIPRPLLEARADAAERIAAYATIKGRIATAGSGGTVTRLPDGPLDAAMVAMAATFGLSPTSVTVEGEDVKLALGAARYDAVVPWLAALEATGQVAIVEARMTRGQAVGTVDLTMTVRRI